MSALLVSIAALVTRGWTRAYTSGLPPDERQARLDEIESAGATTAVVASLIVSGFVVSASGPSIPATKALRVDVVAHGWIDGGTVDGRRRIVPVASFRLANVTNRPLRAVQVNALFAWSATDRSGTVAVRDGFGTAWASVAVGGGLMPGASVVSDAA